MARDCLMQIRVSAEEKAKIEADAAAAGKAPAAYVRDCLFTNQLPGEQVFMARIAADVEKTLAGMPKIKPGTKITVKAPANFRVRPVGSLLKKDKS